MLLALISSAAAIATGIIDDTLIGHLGSVFPIWENHGWVQILSSMVFLILFIWRTRYPYFYETPKLQWFYLISSGISVYVAEVKGTDIDLYFQIGGSILNDFRLFYAY